jgi:cell volume regulation protein A
VRRRKSIGPSDQLLAILAGTLVAALLAMRFAFRLGVSLVLFFIVVGMLIGSEGLGGIAFEDYTLAQTLGTLALVVILFDGGLQTEAKLFRIGLWPGVILASVGTIATALLVGAFAVLVLGTGWVEGMLLGSIVSSTDAAAVFAALRKQNITLKKRVQAVLEIESSLNDPPAVYLTVAMTALLLRGEAPSPSLLLGFLMQMGLGLALGWLGGRAAAALLRRTRLDWPSLYPVLILGMAFFLFACTNLLGGSGYLAVYVAGVVLGNQPLPFKPMVARFHDGLSWLMQILMFAMLGLLVFPSRLVPVAVPAIAIGMFLILVARPLIVALLLFGSGLDLRERMLVAWGGLRGAVPIILAIHPLTQGVAEGHRIFNITFFVVILSVLLQGTTIPWLARRLRLHLPSQAPPSFHVELGSWHLFDGEVLLFRVDPSSSALGMALRDLPLPPEALAMLIVRNDGLITPRGSTVLQSGDYVYFFGKERDRAALEKLFQDRPAT